MTKTKEEEVVSEEVVVEPTNKEQKARWTAFLDRYQAQNPVKFAVKKANGEFDKIPDSFIG